MSETDYTADGTFESYTQTTYTNTYDAADMLSEVFMELADMDGVNTRTDHYAYTYDESGRTTRTEYTYDWLADGVFESLRIDTWAFDEVGNETFYSYEMDAEADGTLDNGQYYTRSDFVYICQ